MNSNLLLPFVGLFILISVELSSSSHPRFNIIHRHEVLNDRYSVEWTANMDEEYIEFTTTVQTTGFIGFGFSYTGGMEDSDIFIGGVSPSGSLYGEDRHGTGRNEPTWDASQDYEVISGSENSTHTILRFRRKLNTCDDKDIAINDDTIKIIWAIGETDDIIYHGSNRGILAVNFLDPHSESPDLAPYEVWAAAQDFNLPSDDTVYWCTFYKAPVLQTKHHIVGFNVFTGTNDSKHHTHHVDVYKCTAPDGQDADEYFGRHLGYGYDCYYSDILFPVEDCTLFEFQWSIGGGVTMFPDDLGVPFGGGGKSEYYMTEVHYDNPDEKQEMLMRSGMEFYYTPQLREIDAGFLFIGSVTSKKYASTIPPASSYFVQAHHCPGGCTSNLPDEGINAFVYLLHSHLSGRTQRLRHFRNGTELPWFANDEHYDFNYQSNRMLREEIKIMPGDHLTLECHYDTTWKKLGDPMINTTTTIGGRSPREEMCQVFVMYYPRQEEVNMCGSYFSPQKMLDYFGIQNVTDEKGEIDPIVLAPWQWAGERYTQVIQNRIQWTEARRIEFQEYTRYGAHQAYCDPVYSEEQIGSITYPIYDEDYRPPDACA